MIVAEFEKFVPRKFVRFAEHVRVAARRSSYVPLYAKRLAINYACPSIPRGGATSLLDK